MGLSNNKVSDSIFTDLLLYGLGPLLGIGEERGIGLLFVLIFIMTVTFVAYCYPHIRLVEDELPDVVSNV